MYMYVLEIVSFILCVLCVNNYFLREWCSVFSLKFQLPSTHLRITQHCCGWKPLSNRLCVTFVVTKIHSWFSFRKCCNTCYVHVHGTNELVAAFPVGMFTPWVILCNNVHVYSVHVHAVHVNVWVIAYFVMNLIQHACRYFLLIYCWPNICGFIA